MRWRHHRWSPIGAFGSHGWKFALVQAKATFRTGKTPQGIRISSSADVGRPNFPVVAIGASADGFDAVRGFLAKLPPDSGMAFVVIPHLDASRKSELASLLPTSTSLPVLEVSAPSALQPNHVYLVPRNKRALIRDGVLSLESLPKRVRRHPIDDFMTALAAAMGDRAVGVVLSGTGSDGARGLAAIRAADGFTFAQGPGTAQSSVLPLSATDAGMVDLAMSPTRIALELERLVHPSYRPDWQRDATKEIEEIFEILQSSSGIDFRHYTLSTVVRCILRQMTVKGVGTVTQYARLLRRSPKERESLVDVIFAPSTGFFRDAHSFETLRKQVRSSLSRKSRPQTLRVWVPGCSTGEEAYSIAMLLAEEMDRLPNPMETLVFGTDIRESAIEYSRAGVYPETALAGVSTARLKRFFTASGGVYRIKPELRKPCLFARHDLTTDPPITNLDLISCRNVLPYLEAPSQAQALAAFKFALKPGGFLFTDSSIADTASSPLEMNRSIHGIHSRQHGARKSAGPVRSPGERRSEPGTSMAPIDRQRLTRAVLIAANAAHKVVCQENTALSKDLRDSNLRLQTLASNLGSLLTGSDVAVLVLDSRRHIVRFTLAAANLFHLTSSQEGAHFLRAASNLGDTPWKTLLADVTRRGQTVERSFQHRNGRCYSLRMKPFGETRKGATGVLLVLLDENDVRSSLLETRNSLGKAEDTVQMLLDVSPQAIFAVDASDKIIWANKTTSAMFGYSILELLGQAIDALIPSASPKRPGTHHKRFFAAVKPRPGGLARELRGLRQDGSSFPIEIGVSKTRATVAVAFVTDITERKELEQAVRQRESERSALVDSSPDTLLRFDPNLRVTHSNAALEKLTGASLVGKSCSNLPFPPANLRVCELILRKVFRTGRPQRYEFPLPSAVGETHHEVRFVPEFSPSGAVAAVLAIGRDITEAKEVVRTLREREKVLAELLDNSPDVMARVDPNLRLLFVNAAWTRMTGIPRKSALGKTCHELGLSPSAVALQKRALRRVLKTATPVTTEFTLQSAQGLMALEAVNVPEFDANRVSSILMIGRDITDRKRIQELSARSEQDIHRLTARLVTAQEQERRRIARDLHDSIGQLLSALAAEIGSTALDLNISGPARQRLQAARESALRIVEEARRIARQLHPAIVEDLGLAKSLQSLCDEFSQRTGIPAAFAVRGASSPVPIEVAACAYRIGQQALNNVGSHARAKHASVRLSLSHSLQLSIRDDGIGFDRSSVSDGGLGLISMSERARMAGGKLWVKSQPGQGTAVRLELPLPGGSE